jgi:anti-anti-sigma regulatory factor
MALCGIPSNVQALLELTRLNEIFELFTSTDAALAAALGNT